MDLLSENLIPMGKAASHIPGRPSRSTLERWRIRGVRGRVLETCLVGGRHFTSLEAIKRFLRGENDGNGDGASLKPHGSSPTPTQRRREAAAAAAELDAMLGVK